MDKTTQLYLKAKRAALLKLYQLPPPMAVNVGMEYEVQAVRNSALKRQWWIIPEGTKGQGAEGCINGIKWRLWEATCDTAEQAIARYGHRVYRLP